MSFAVTGIGILTPQGRGPALNRRALKQAPETAISAEELGVFSATLAGRLCRPLPEGIRSKLGKGVLSPASALAVLVARDALADAGRLYTEIQHERCGLFLASSRGNLAGWLDPWQGRRSRKLLRASNSSHAEITSAVQQELQIQGPVHISADGCAAGLSALTLAHAYLRSGMIDQALVVAVDLPLTSAVLTSYAESGLLGEGSNAPFSSSLANGMIPAEGAAALLLENKAKTAQQFHPTLETAITRHEAYHLLHSDPQAKRLGSWLGAQLDLVDPEVQKQVYFCPHASGTKANCITELALLSQLTGVGDIDLVLKDRVQVSRPWIGHAIGATGLIDLALALHSLRDGYVLCNELNPDLSAIATGELEGGTKEQSVTEKTLQLHWSLGIGGQFSACVIAPPKQASLQGHSLHFSVSKQVLLVKNSAQEITHRFPCSSAAKGIGFAEGSFQTPTGQFEVREKYGHASSLRTTFTSRRPQGSWTNDDAEGTKVTHGILRLHGLDEENANTWDRYIYIHGTNQLCYPPQNLSHGCLTLAEKDFRALFHLVAEGAKLRIEK